MVRLLPRAISPSTISYVRPSVSGISYHGSSPPKWQLVPPQRGRSGRIPLQPEGVSPSQSNSGKVMVSVALVRSGLICQRCQYEWRKEYPSSASAVTVTVEPARTSPSTVYVTPSVSMSSRDGSAEQEPGETSAHRSAINRDSASHEG